MLRIYSPSNEAVRLNQSRPGISMSEKRITPARITELGENEVFVFGSNLAGRHGKGAALEARKWGAVYGQAKGAQGRTYAIPTKDSTIKNALPVEEIGNYVQEFIAHAKENPSKIFYVTEVGCHLAGYSYSLMVPLWKEALEVDNIYLPEVFYNYLRLL